MQLNEVASHVKIVKSTGAISNLTKILGPEATDNIYIFFSSKSSKQIAISDDMLRLAC